MTPTLLFIAAALFSGFASKGLADQTFLNLDQGKPLFADITLDIPGLGPCDGNPDRSLHLDSRQPVIVLVHGARGSPAQFHRLAQEIASRGQQTACFKYNDRDSLMLSSGQLRHALDNLANKMNNKNMTIVGHSLGALVARKSMVSDRPDPLQDEEMRLRLVSVSGPFAGVEMSNSCEYQTAKIIRRWICKLVMGDKWSEITPSSGFILQPGALAKQVREFLEIVTDEHNSCRQLVNGLCIQSDYVFSLEEQRNPAVDGNPITKIVEVKAGHDEIVGDNYTAPAKLIHILQQHGILEETQILRPTMGGLI